MPWSLEKRYILTKKKERKKQETKTHTRGMAEEE